MNDKQASLRGEATKRIAKNTLVLYVRMMFSMLVSLYTSRVVLNTLGVEDYGIYNVVGGFVGLFSLVSGSLSSSTSRFLTFELGKGDGERLKRIFSTSLSIHVLLAVSVWILAETVGVWFLNTRMVITPERLHAANWVFQASLLSFVSGVFCVPFNASIIAHEKMGAFAYIGILEVLLKLSIVLFIAYSPWAFDRLVVYACLLVAVSLSVQFVYWLYCNRHFEECRLRFGFDKSYWKEMGAFAGWNFIGCTAGTLENQGVSVLLNLFYGPSLNAARGIASSVNAAVCSFAGNFMTALHPQITKSYASGEHDYMMSLVERGARFSFYILLILILPILLETEFILTLWLKSYPEHTVNFVRLVLLLSLQDVLSNTLIVVQAATGKLRDYQLAVGGMLMMTFPLAYFCLKVGFPPESIMLAALFVYICCMLLRLFFLKRMVGLSVWRFLKNVCFNVWKVAFLSAILPFFLFSLMEEGWGRFGVVSAASLVSSATLVYCMGCSISERRFIMDKVCGVYRKMFRL